LPKIPAKARPAANPGKEWAQVGLRMAPDVRRALGAAAKLRGQHTEVYLDGVLRKHLSDLGLLKMAAAT
jgi:hypothetical protein